MSMLPFAVVPLLAAILIFPAVVGRALGDLVERLELGGWAAKAALVATLAVVWWTIYRDAVRLEYAAILSQLWREWCGK